MGKKNIRVLFQMLDNPLRRNSGNKTWNLALLHYFKLRGIRVDFITERDHVNWEVEEIDHFKNSGLVDSFYVLDRKPKGMNRVQYFLRHTLTKLFYRKRFDLSKSAMEDYRSAYYQMAFNNVLKQNAYDFILINYVINAKLIKNNPLVGQAKTIIDTHDFFTSQFQGQPKFNLGASFGEEIARLSLFDEVWVSSADELYVFGQFIPNRVRLVQTMLPKPIIQKVAINSRKYDLIYVASNNGNNQKSAKWFFEKVYPTLPDRLQICVIGQINQTIPDLPNVHKIPFAEQLDDYYQQSKVAICPMLAGTGIKIKVVEAFSYGIPIVCNIRGLDGLLNKTNNGCMATDDPLDFAAYIMELLNDPEKYQSFSKMSVSMFDQFFNIQDAYKRLDKIFGVI